MLDKYRYEDLTWPEINEAVAAGRIPLLPVGAIEQHGPHLPLKIDRWEST
ncbi:MAG TPA: creatininase family protein, partial [Chloroflexota bacterium]|nr:creatininase family protein [Chloroflexota bacterium]